MAHLELCLLCKGTGKYYDKKCHGCEGKGQVIVPDEVPYYPPYVPPTYPDPTYPHPPWTITWWCKHNSMCRSYNNSRWNQY